MDFSARVKELCKAKNIMLKDLAEKINITPIGLSRTLHQSYPQLQTLERIAGALGVEVYELFVLPESDVVHCPHCGGALKITVERVVE